MLSHSLTLSHQCPDCVADKATTLFAHRRRLSRLTYSQSEQTPREQQTDDECLVAKQRKGPMCWWRRRRRRRRLHHHHHHHPHQHQFQLQLILMCCAISIPICVCFIFGNRAAAAATVARKKVSERSNTSGRRGRGRRRRRCRRRHRSRRLSISLLLQTLLQLRPASLIPLFSFFLSEHDNKAVSLIFCSGNGCLANGSLLLVPVVHTEQNITDITSSDKVVNEEIVEEKLMLHSDMHRGCYYYYQSDNKHPTSETYPNRWDTGRRACRSGPPLTCTSPCGRCTRGHAFDCTVARRRHWPDRRCCTSHRRQRFGPRRSGDQCTES